MANEIETGLPDRNLVAHGAFFVEGADFGVAHYFRQGKKPNHRWYETTQRITDRMAREAIAQIDRLLREAVDLRFAVEKWWASRRPYYPGKEGA